MVKIAVCIERNIISKVTEKKKTFPDDNREIWDDKNTDCSRKQRGELLSDYLYLSYLHESLI